MIFLSILSTDGRRVPSEHSPAASWQTALRRAIRDGEHLMRELGLPPHLVVYGIEAMQFDIGSELSEGVRQAVPEVVRRVRQDIRELQMKEAGDNHYA